MRKICSRAGISETPRPLRYKAEFHAGAYQNLKEAAQPG